MVSSDGSAIHSDTEMATHFNKYFSSVFTCEDTASIPTVDSTSSPLLDDSIEITPATVFSKLIALQSNKSSEPDGWPITIIKSVSEFISVSLSILFNKSLNSGTLPSDWKCANVTPIHKKGARNLACNYRPVSLTSIFSKLMESIVKNHNEPPIYKQLTVSLSIWLYTRKIVFHSIASDAGLFNSSS